MTTLCTLTLVDGLLRLESIHPYSSLEEVKANTGWNIDQKEVSITPAPTDEELTALEQVDPQRVRDVEF